MTPTVVARVLAGLALVALAVLPEYGGSHFGPLAAAAGVGVLFGRVRR